MNKFIKSTIILIIGGFITKILGMIIKIVITRMIKSSGYGLYALIMPTMMLLISLSQLGLPTALNVLIAKNKNTKKLITASLIISLSLDLIIALFLLLESKYISTNLLKEPRVYLGLLGISLILPFISISNILRSYYFAKERMLPHVITNILEDIVKLGLILLFLPYFLSKGISQAIFFIVITNIFSELTSIIGFIILLPKFTCKKKDIKPNKGIIKSLLNIALPTTGSRIVGSIGFFLEPIIITSILYKIGYTNNYIVTEYGIINGYVLPLILLPSFFTAALSQALIPNESKNYSKNKYNLVERKIKQAIIASLIIGIPCTIIFTIIPEVPLKLIYNTNEGVNYIKFLAPICLLHYIQSPISSSLQAMNQAKTSFRGTVYGTIIRTLLLFILSFKLGMWALVIATSANILFVTIYDYINVKKVLKEKI
jgi:stage V sporulation protein B